MYNIIKLMYDFSSQFILKYMDLKTPDLTSGKVAKRIFVRELILSL